MATQTVKERIWRPSTIKYIVARITLSDPSTLRDSNYTTNPGANPVIYLSDKGQSENPASYAHGRGMLYNVDGDTKHYQPLILDWIVTHQSLEDDGTLTPATGVLVLANKRIQWQKKRAGATAESDQIFVKLSQLRSDYLWDGAAIQILIATEQFDYSANASAGVQFHEHAGQQIFKGIINKVRHTRGQVIIEMAENLLWDRTIADSEQPAGGLGPSIITRKDYPNAPDNTIGSMIPMVFSRQNSSVAGGRYTGYGPHTLDCLSPCVVTKVGASTQSSFRVFLNKWSAHGAVPISRTNELFLYHPDSGLLSHFDLYSSNESTTERYYNIENDIETGFVEIHIRADQYISDTLVTSPTSACDGKADTYATIENGDILHLRIPQVGPYGPVRYLTSYVIFDATSVGAGATNGTVNVKFGLWNDTLGNWHLPTNNETPTKNPGVLTKSKLNNGYTTYANSDYWYQAGGGEWNDPKNAFSAWRFGEWASSTGFRENISFRIQGVEAGCSAKVIAAGLALVYFPTRHAGSKYIGAIPGGNGGAWGRGGKN